MAEVPVALFWELPDGTRCVLYKDPRADSWPMRVARGPQVLRAETFSNPIVAMDHAKEWRAAFLERESRKAAG